MKTKKIKKGDPLKRFAVAHIGKGYTNFRRWFPTYEEA
jgi:hypothetical protein